MKKKTPPVKRNRLLEARGRVDPEVLPRGPNGRALCRYCSVEVPERRKTFCSAVCVHEWKVRTQPSYARKEVFKRDRGVCRSCHLDTNRQRLDLLALKRKDPQEWAAVRQRMYDSHRVSLKRRFFFDVDHLVAVSVGGGACGLDNLQTLCIACHRAKTKVDQKVARRLAPRPKKVPKVESAPPKKTSRKKVAKKSLPKKSTPKKSSKKAAPKATKKSATKKRSKKPAKKSAPRKRTPQP